MKQTKDKSDLSQTSIPMLQIHVAQSLDFVNNLLIRDQLEKQRYAIVSLMRKTPSQKACTVKRSFIFNIC